MTVFFREKKFTLSMLSDNNSRFRYFSTAQFIPVVCWYLRTNSPDGVAVGEGGSVWFCNRRIQELANGACCPCSKERIRWNSEIWILDGESAVHGHAQTSHLLGLIYRTLGNNQKALMCFQEAFRKRRLLLCRYHPCLESTYYHLSRIHNHLVDYDIAINNVTKVLDIQSIKFPHYHSDWKLTKALLQRLRR